MWVTDLENGSDDHIPVGGAPSAQALSADGKYLYVAVRDRILIIDTTSPDVVGSVSVSDAPQEMVVDPQTGSLVYTDAVNQRIGFINRGQVTGDVVARDAESDTLSYAVAAAPEHGTVVIDRATGKWIYISDAAGLIQDDSFTITVTDGVGAATTGDDVVPPWWRRALAEQDAGESLSRMIAMGALGAVVAALVGVGVGAGRGIYWLMERCSPRIGRLWWSPWATAAVVVGAALWFLGLLTGPSLKLIPRFPMLWPDLSFGEWVTSWASWQLVIALGATAYFVHAWGWAAVPRKAVEPSKQNADGTWREIPEGQKIDIGYDPSALPVYVPPEPFDDDCIGDEAGFVPGEDEEIR